MSTQRQASESSADRSSKQHIVAAIASMAGTTIEWYDFFLYGSAAALIFNRIFFPDFDPLMGTLAAFATYSVGFFARPFGGIIFGHFGDRVGRKSMFLITIILMGIPTILIGLVPSYESIGYWAAFLLVLLRFMQGVAVGGDWGGAVLMAVEHAPEGKKGFFGSLPQAGVAPGLLLSSFALALVSALPEEAMLSWGWRLPFLASAVLLLVGLFVRLRVAETPDFQAMQSGGKKDSLPAKTVIMKHPRSLLTVVGARLGEVTWFYTVATFALAYATKTLGIAEATVLHAVMWGAGLSFFTMPLAGMLGDRIGHRRVFMIGALGMLVFSGFFFSMLATGTTSMITLAMLIAIGCVYACLYGTEAILFSNQFPPEIRYSGISIGVQVSGAIGGGLAPLIATWLLSVGNGNPIYVVLYLVTLAVIAGISAWLMRSSPTASLLHKGIQNAA